MWALTMLKDFRIAPCIRKIDMPKLFTLGMKDPVVLFNFKSLICYTNYTLKAAMAEDASAAAQSYKKSKKVMIESSQKMAKA